MGDFRSGHCIELVHNVNKGLFNAMNSIIEDCMGFIVGLCNFFLVAGKFIVNAIDGNGNGAYVRQGSQYLSRIIQELVLTIQGTQT